MSDASRLVAPTELPLAMGPLVNSHEADQTEADLKDAIIEVFDAMLRPRVARLNAYGMPHRGDLESVERFVKADGLALDRQNGRETYMRELFRAWKARNPRRGTAFLRHYLQLLYAGTATVDQLWQDPARPYPDGTQPDEAAGFFLTSRIRVSLDSTTGFSVAELTRLRGILLSILPARMVLEMYLKIGAGFESSARVACTMNYIERNTFSGAAAPAV